MLLDFNYLITKYSMNINGILHIGGHYGEEFDSYQAKNIKNVVFFEPAPDNFSILSNRIGNKAILINKALGNDNRKINLNIETANNGQSNSILKPALHLKQYPHIIFNNVIEVDMVKLDDFLPTLNIEIINFNMINIDVQGYELEVFKGGEKTLNSIDYIITEVNRDVVYQQNAFVEDIDLFLGKYGFIRCETSWDGNTWGDALYIKQKNA